jgi:hypothetical protein
MPAPYPQQNLFNSVAWADRLSELGLSVSGYEVEKKSGFIPVAYRANHHLVDFEDWPQPDFFSSEDFRRDAKGAQLAFFRKLSLEGRPAELPRNSFTWVSTVSPYLDLGGKLNFHKRAMEDIKRCERNLTAAVSAPRLSLADSASRQSWFEQWFLFQEQRRQSQGQHSPLSDPATKSLFHRWITGGSQPSWLKLFQLDAGEKALCRGLCLVHEGVFYFQLPSFNPDPGLRKFGLGKLFVQKLVDWSLENKLKIFDFLQGDEEYKFSWNPVVRKLYQCEVPLTLAGRAMVEFRRRRIRSKFEA